MTYFQEKLYDEIMRLIKEEASKEYFSYNEKQNFFILKDKSLYLQALKTLPLIKFKSKSSVFEWHPNDYLIKERVRNKKETRQIYSLAFLSGGSTILGATFMRNYDISFNVKTMQISFVRANCSDSKIFYEIY